MSGNCANTSSSQACYSTVNNSEVDPENIQIALPLNITSLYYFICQVHQLEARKKLFDLSPKPH